jgi:TolB-like protein
MADLTIRPSAVYGSHSLSGTYWHLVNDLLAQLETHFGGAYEFERELGGGGMSRVVLARDTHLDRRVVIKILPQSLTAGISTERFEREIMLSAALQHPNIVPVLSAGKVDGLPYFLMPFIDGESLRARMIRGPLSARETVNILKDVTRALAFAHGRGVIHRDIKPDNVLLTTGGAAVVTDFGVAKALSASLHSGGKSGYKSMTGIGMSPGTPAYMAPEQAAADPATDHRADLYALGIVGYEMLTGAPPFHGRSPQALLAAQMSEKPASVSSRRYDVPKALADLLMQCLEKDPKRRPQSATAMLRALEDPSVISGVFAVPASSSAKAWRSVIGAAGLLAAVAAFMVWRTTNAASDAAAPAPTDSVRAVVARSLAVIPLSGIGNDQRARDAAEGLTSEVLNAVTGVSGLRVASPAATRTAADSGASLIALGRSLGVTHVLQGTVQRERQQLRVILRLVRVANDSTVWSSSFNGSTDSTLALQDAVARAVASAAAQAR